MCETDDVVFNANALEVPIIARSMERRMTASQASMARRLTMSRASSVRRPTEASMALSASKDKSLSAVSLTKRTNSLVYDVEEIKSNLKELQVQGREVVLQEHTVQDLSAKVMALHHAFESLSDVCIYVEDTQKKMNDHVDRLTQRIAMLEKSVTTLQAQAPKADAKRKRLQATSEHRFSEIQEAFAKLALSVYETQAELSRAKNSADDLMAREQEAMHLTQTLQATQEQTTDWLHQLKREAAQLTTELEILKEQTGATGVTLASDIQVLAQESASVRSAMVQQHGQWTQKLDSLREAMDRQSRIEKSQLMQRLDALSETVATHELRAKDAVGSLLKNHGKLREVVSDSMAICSSEIKILSQEWKAVQHDHREKLEHLVRQISDQSLDASQKYETLRCAVQSMAIQLDLTI